MKPKTHEQSSGVPKQGFVTAKPGEEIKMKPKEKKIAEETKEPDKELEDIEEKVVLVETPEEIDVLSEDEVKAASEERALPKAVALGQFDINTWKPKTKTGELVKNKEIKDIDELLDNGVRILEAEIVDALIPNLSSDLLLVGQSKGKFGGGQRRVFRQTQKKTKEGNKPKFTTFAVVGDLDGHVGAGRGKSKETVPAREKAIRNAKRELIKIRRGCGSWQCDCKTPHSLPFAVTGKCGSSTLTLMPAPKGTGLIVQKECAKMLRMAGIKDVWSKVSGQTKTSLNLLDACFTALKKTTKTKMLDKYKSDLGVVEGSAHKGER